MPEYLFASQIDAYVADNLFRKRDPRFKDARRHKPTREDEPFAKPKRDLKFQPKDFQLAADHSHAICPAGKRSVQAWPASRCCAGFDGSGLSRAAQRLSRAARFGRNACAIRERTPVRQVAVLHRTRPGRPQKSMDKMKRKIDSELGRHIYGRRLGTIEPVFGNIRHTKRLNRFTLRGRRKVNAQWQLYCLVHNIEKLQRYGRLDARARSRKAQVA